MLCTVIRDVYRQNDTKMLAEALDDIASPIDQNGWASAGVYCFWDPNTNEILYIGLAADLGQRVMQHNGLKPCNEEGCKFQQVQEWFKLHEELGFSILVQSMLSQPRTSRNSEVYEPSLFLKMHPELFDPLGAIRMTEGLLIGSEKVENNRLPPWNKIGGSRVGAQKATKSHNQLARLFTYSDNDEFVARKSIRDVSENPTFEAFELHLHGVRQLMAVHGINFEEAWDATPDSLHAKARIVEQGYLKQ